MAQFITLRAAAMRLIRSSSQIVIASDRERFLEVLGEVVERYGWLCHAHCLMTNYYHLLIETPDSNLSRGMRQLNGIYTQWINREYGRSGHVFQGRFKSILVMMAPNSLIYSIRYHHSSEGN